MQKCRLFVYGWPKSKYPKKETYSWNFHQKGFIHVENERELHFNCIIAFSRGICRHLEDWSSLPRDLNNGQSWRGRQGFDQMQANLTFIMRTIVNIYERSCYRWYFKNIFWSQKYNKNRLHLHLGVPGFQISNCSRGTLRNVNVNVNVISKDK